MSSLPQDAISQAKRLLTETDWPISAIADHLDFPDAKIFSEWFESQVGVTPSALRNLVRGDRSAAAAAGSQAVQADGLRCGLLLAADDDEEALVSVRALVQAFRDPGRVPVSPRRVKEPEIPPTTTKGEPWPAAALPSVEILYRVAEERPWLRPQLEGLANGFFDPYFKVEQLREAVPSSNYWTGRFRRELGLTPSEVVRDCRMETARRELADTSLGIDEVAYRAGFETLRTLQRNCRPWCRLTPSELRDHARRARGRLERLPGRLGDEVFSWHFVYRYRRGEVGDPELEPVVEMFEEAYYL